MNEQRKSVLQMLAEGQVSADEAEQLIAALDREQPDTPSTVDSRPKARPKYLRVVVNIPESSDDGPTRVNVRVPLQLLRAGVRLASLVPPEAIEHVNDGLRRSGMPIDLSRLKPEQLEELIEHLDEVTVEVDQPDAKVNVFCE
jgi:hypothetical protein